MPSAINIIVWAASRLAMSNAAPQSTSLTERMPLACRFQSVVDDQCPGHNPAVIDGRSFSADVTVGHLRSKYLKGGIRLGF